MYKANVNLFSLYLFCKNLIDQNRKNKLFKLVKNSKKQETAVCALYKVLIVTEIDIKIMKTTKPTTITKTTYILTEKN